jgi:transcriptional regulator with XRE-family HTH domain/molybdate-binding protein
MFLASSVACGGRVLGREVRRLRVEQGLTQARLAELAGVSRQLVGAVEAERHLPRVDAAVALARVLGVPVEELLGTPPGCEIVGVTAPPREGALVRTVTVGDRLVCVPSADSGAAWARADAVVRDGRLERFEPARDAALVAGCDPAITTVAGLLDASGGGVVPVLTSSRAAAAALAGGLAHAAIVHGRDGEVAVPPDGVRRWWVARWQVGLAAPPDAPHDWVATALAGQLPVVQREPGAGSQAAFERAVAAAGRTEPTSITGPVVGSHEEAARRAALDGMVAVTIEPAALAAGAAFHPLEEHVSQLWAAPTSLDTPAVRRFLDELVGARLRRRLDRVGGYDLSQVGVEIAV